MSIISERFSKVKTSNYAPQDDRQKKRRIAEKRLRALQKESARYTVALRSTKAPEAIELAGRMENCANGAWVYGLHGLPPHIRLGKPCSEPACPLCRDKRQRWAYMSSLPAFEQLLRQDPHLKFSMITLTAPPLYGDLPAFMDRVARFLKDMNFKGAVRGVHMTCGQEGPQAHCHLLAFYHGDPPTEAECCAKWGGHVDVKTKDSSAETAASMYAYLYKGYQPSEGEDVRKLPEASKLRKGLRVSKKGEAIKRAFREAKSQRAKRRVIRLDVCPGARAVFLSKGFLFFDDVSPLGCIETEVGSKVPYLSEVALARMCALRSPPCSIVRREDNGLATEKE